MTYEAMAGPLKEGSVVANVLECAVKCYADNDCKSISYGRVSNTRKRGGCCYLHEYIATETHDENAVLDTSMHNVLSVYALNTAKGTTHID